MTENSMVFTTSQTITLGYVSISSISTSIVCPLWTSYTLMHFVYAFIFATKIISHCVSGPLASSPSGLMEPSDHILYICGPRRTIVGTTKDAITNRVRIHLLNPHPHYKCLAGHASQVWLETYSFSAHCITSHTVSGPLASSPAALYVPGGHLYTFVI